MNKETVKKLLDIWFNLSTWYDWKNSHPCLQYNLWWDYELLIEYREDWYILEWIDFQRDLKVNSISEIEIIIKSLN